MANDEFDALEREVVDHVFELYPPSAVGLGLHAYDGRLPLSDRSATDRWLSESTGLEARLKKVEAANLSEDRQIDRLLLELLLVGPRFDLAEVQEFDRNPMTYLASLSMTSYIAREYAPVPVRVEGIVHILEAIPAYLEGGRRRLRDVLPKPFVFLAISMGQGLPSHFAEAEAFARRGSKELGDRVAAARGLAEAGLREFLEDLKTRRLPKANDAFALGPKLYQRLLYVREGIERPFSEIEKAGRADLERNQRRLEQISRESHKTIPQLLEHLNADHPNAADLIPTARSLVDGACRFVEEHALVTVPEGARARVEETPAWGRSLSTASMESPGPFE
ncbi:MAG: DUF885 family protein, partial [Thermoplasmata archaeon]